MEGIKKLKELDKSLFDEYSKMTHEELLNQICLEVIDLLYKEEQVALFMEQCTSNMSNTNYTLDAIKTLINEKQEENINEYCVDLLEMDSDEMYDEIFSRTTLK